MWDTLYVLTQSLWKVHKRNTVSLSLNILYAIEKSMKKSMLVQATVSVSIAMDDVGQDSTHKECNVRRNSRSVIDVRKLRFFLAFCFGMV